MTGEQLEPLSAGIAVALRVIDDPASTDAAAHADFAAFYGILLVLLDRAGRVRVDPEHEPASQQMLRDLIEMKATLVDHHDARSAPIYEKGGRDHEFCRMAWVLSKDVMTTPAMTINRNVWGKSVLAQHGRWVGAYRHIRSDLVEQAELAVTDPSTMTEKAREQHTAAFARVNATLAALDRMWRGVCEKHYFRGHPVTFEHVFAYTYGGTFIEDDPTTAN